MTVIGNEGTPAANSVRFTDLADHADSEKGSHKGSEKGSHSGMRGVTSEIMGTLQRSLHLDKEDSDEDLGKKGYYITDTFRKVECKKFIPSKTDQGHVPPCKRADRCSKDDFYEESVRSDRLTSFVVNSQPTSMPEVECMMGEEWYNVRAPCGYSRCKCGNYWKEHTCDTYEVNPSLEWNYRIDTKQCPTDAYGDIDFKDLAADVFPRYLRCAWDTDSADLSELMLKKWQMPKPKLIMVVIGGKTSFSNVDKNFVKAIQNGIVEAAVSTHAWILTGGMDNGSFPAKYDKHIHNSSPCVNIKGLKELEPNHTNFVFPDWGTWKNYQAIDLHNFKVKLEKEICKETDAQHITIVIEGGLTAMVEIAQRAEEKIAIVVINGSGRASDLICEVLEITKGASNDKDYHDFMSTAQRRQVQKMIADCFNSSSDKEFLDQALDSVQLILKYREYITVWKDEGKDGRVDKHILIGLIKSLALNFKPKELVRASEVNISNMRTSQINAKAEEKRRLEEEDKDRLDTKKRLQKRQIDLAITWNRLDLARELLDHIQIGKVEYNELLFEAILNKRIQFMDAFLERGADFKSFLREERFNDLLSDKRLVPEHKLLHRLLNRQMSKEARKSSSKVFEHFFNVIYDVSDGVYKCPKKLKKDNASNYELVTKKGQMMGSLLCSSSSARDKSEMRFINGDMDPCDKSPDFQDPENLLVLFFVMIHEQEMAKYIWNKSRTPLILALICSNICYWQADQEDNMKEITQEMKTFLLVWANEWEQIALELLHQAAKTNTPAWVQTLITHKFYSWGGRSTLDIAVASKSQNFIAHHAIQQYVTKSWMGKLDADTRYWKILISSFIGPWWLITFNNMKTKEEELENNTQKWERKKQAFISKGVGGDTTEATVGELKNRNLAKKWVVFYKAPVTKYFIHIFIYVLYLATFTYALIIKNKNVQKGTPNARELERRFNGSDIPDTDKLQSNDLYFSRFSIQELIIFFWSFAVLPVELRQIYHSMPSTPIAKLSKYIHNQYNKNDVTSFLLLMAAFIIRLMQLAGPMWTYIFQLLFCLAFVLNVIRVSQFLQIHSQIGPKITMISSMFQDLFFFITIVAICIVGYGVATESLMFPTGQSFSPDTVFDIIWRPYINLFGELGVDTIDENLQQGYCQYWNEMHNSSAQFDCSDDGPDSYSCDADSICRSNRIVVKVMLGVYMMLAAVLMLNLLIAVFSHTYENLNVQSDKLWKWQRFDLMREFQHRSAIPFPFNTLTYFLRALRWLWRQFCGAKEHRDHREASKRRDEYKASNIALLENECRRNLMKEKKEREEGDDKQHQSINECLERLNKVQQHVQGFDGQMQNVLDYTVQNVFNQGVSDSGTIGFHGRRGEVEVDGASAVSTDKPQMNTCPVPILHSPMSPVGGGRYPPNANDQLYPGTDIIRSVVKEQHREWMVPLLAYKPPSFTKYHTSTENIKWNEGDRVSYNEYYSVKDGLPLYPQGRTGLSGKGVLERWGPNYVSIPIITRFLRSTTNTSLEAELEVVCKASPGGYQLPQLDTTIDQPLPKAAKALFNNTSSEDPKGLQKRLQKIWKRGILIKRGLLENNYNTDNAWVESMIVSYHDDDDKAFQYIAFDDNSEYHWARVLPDMFSRTHLHKYFERAVYARRVSQYVPDEG